MSAIGSYAVMRRSQFPACVDYARQIRSESTGKWLFKKTEVVGANEFKQAWQAALVEEVHFDYSGYVLGNYLLAQEAGIRPRWLMNNPKQHAPFARYLRPPFRSKRP